MSKLEERENRRKSASIVGSIIGEPAAAAARPAGRGRPREDRELKKRISLSVFPSVYEDIQKIAYVQRKSTSELVGDILEKYRGEHQDALREYENIKKT